MNQQEMDEAARKFAEEVVFDGRTPSPEVWLTPNQARSDMLTVIDGFKAGAAFVLNSPCQCDNCRYPNMALEEKQKDLSILCKSLEHWKTRCEELERERNGWRWVPQILAGQNFTTPLEAKKFLQNEFLEIRAEMVDWKNESELNSFTITNRQKMIEALRQERDALELKISQAVEGLERIASEVVPDGRIYLEDGSVQNTCVFAREVLGKIK